MVSTPKRVKVFVPATVANVACGFDILGFAVSQPGDEIIAEVSQQPGVRIKKIDGDGGRLPLDSNKNTASVSAQALLNSLNSKIGIDLTLNKRMPLGSGLGSSAASAAAGVVAANILLGTPLKNSELVQFAMLGEEAACGSAHADNVAPALMGGVVLVRSYQPLDLVSIPAPKDLYCTIFHPQFEVKTEDARRILRKEIPLHRAITQWGNIAGLVAGLMQNDFALIGRSLTDVIIEPERALLIPGFDLMKSAAMKAGALGCSISGSGPSLFALSASREIADKVALAMKESINDSGIRSQTFVSPINFEGPKILEVS
jgi:homoserine kinase